MAELAHMPVRAHYIRRLSTPQSVHSKEVKPNFSFLHVVLPIRGFDAFYPLTRNKTYILRKCDAKRSTIRHTCLYGENKLKT